MTTQRIGFACKWLFTKSETPEKEHRDLVKEMNMCGTTVAWLNRQTRSVAEDKLWSVAKHNVQAVHRLIDAVSKLDPRLHMMRVGSDFLPVYTEPTWGYFWQQSDVRDWCQREFAKIGESARKHDIRLSFHPGQFCVLASETPDIVRRSIEEFEYHTDMARWMGYGQTWHDHGFKINVHISGKRGPAGIIETLSKLSPEARNLITIENDEMTWGIDASLCLEKHVALVLDIHHHLIHSGGEYISPTDDRVKRVVDSWRGIRPTIHYSLSRDDHVRGWCTTKQLPDVKHLLESGKANKAWLRAHSDDAWNTACNQWALGFLPQADIMLEAKFKNLAAQTLLSQV